MRGLELRVPPPVVALACAAAVWQLARSLPGLAIDFPGRTALAIAIAAAGLAIDAASLLRFLRAHTTVNPMRPANSTTLVAEGMYRHSRNPMYLGLLLVLTGWALHQGNAAGLAMLPLFVAYITRFQIVPEERMLAAKFGAAYDDYRRAVRRWI